MAQRIIITVSSLHTGGAERTACRLAGMWAACGRRVTLVVTYSGRGECHLALDERVELLYLADHAGTRNSVLPEDLCRLRALRGLIRERRPAVVVSFLTNVNIAAILATVGLGVPVVVSERTHPPCYPMGVKWEWLRRMTYPWAERVVMLTEEGVRWLEKAIPRARGVVIPNSVTYPLERNEPVISIAEHVAGGRSLLLAAGRLDDGKQFDRLLAAFAALADRHPGWDLVILGDGPERGRLEEAIGRSGLVDRVRLPGRAGNMGEWYERADLFVLSSRYEGFPNVLVEAMAYGCPVVSYDCDTGPRDIIRDGVDGLLVRPVGDVDALAGALDSLMSDEGPRREFGGQAVAVRQRFAEDRVLGLWQGIMRGRE